MLGYVVQQVQQFQAGGEDFAMRYQIDESLERGAAAFRRNAIANWREEGVPPEQIAKSLTAEEIVRGLPAKERKRLRAPLEQEGAPSRKKAKKKPKKKK